MKAQRVILRPGETIEVLIAEELCNGYGDEMGSVHLHWQDRDAPQGEIATKQRELQIDWQIYNAGGRVGPVVVTAR